MIQHTTHITHKTALYYYIPHGRLTQELVLGCFFTRSKCYSSSSSNKNDVIFSSLFLALCDYNYFNRMYILFFCANKTLELLLLYFLFGDQALSRDGCSLMSSLFNDSSHTKLERV